MTERVTATDARTILGRVAAGLRDDAASEWARAGDVAAAVVTEAGGVVVADGAPVRHVVAPRAVVEAARKRFGTGLLDGDLLVHNDPCTGGTSLVDLTVVSVAGEGDARRYGVARMRTLDAGGGEPGGVFPAARQLIQEGDRVPPVRIAEGGRLLPDLVRRLAINTRRRSAYERDLVALRQAAESAASVDSMEPESPAALRAVEGEGSSSLVVRGSLLRSPCRITARVVARNGGFEVDFAGTDAADAGPGNIPWSATVASGLEAIWAATGASEPIEVLARRVTWSAPEGSLARPASLAACSAGGLYTAFAVREVVARALAAMGLPRVEWATWSGGAVLSGPPAAEYSTLVPLDCPGALEGLSATAPAVRVEVASQDRWGREAHVKGPMDEGLRLTTWLMEIEAEGPSPAHAPVHRAGHPASVWLSGLR